jgi:hypothetical protein
LTLELACPITKTAVSWLILPSGFEKAMLPNQVPSIMLDACALAGCVQKPDAASTVARNRKICPLMMLFLSGSYAPN